MQISAANIEKSIVHVISANIAHNCTNKAQTHVFRVDDH